MSPEKVIIFESGDSAGRQGSKFGGKLGFSAISLSSKIMIIITKGIHVWPVFVLKRRLAIKFIHNRRIHKPLMFLFRQFGNLSVPKHQVRQNFLNKIEIEWVEHLLHFCTCFLQTNLFFITITLNFLEFIFTIKSLLNSEHLYFFYNSGEPSSNKL